MNVHGEKIKRLIAVMSNGGALRGLSLGVVLILPLGLSGCLLHKKMKLPVFSPAPVELIALPEPANPQMVEAPEAEKMPVPVAEAAATPRPRRRVTPRPVTPTTQPANGTTQVAAADEAAEGAGIGELTAGGDANPQTRQEAVDLIASNEKRLKALSAQTVRTQRSQISKIRNFERQAQEALNSGDAEGAKTLATKARLLLADLDHGGTS